VNILDVVDERKKIDPSNFLSCVHNLPSQLRSACQLGQSLTCPPADYDLVIILGMGGSAIGGELISACFGNDLKIPLFVVRDYDIPSFVSKKTLVIAVSYSGNTEEILSAYRRAREKGASIVSFSSGGKIKKEADDAGHPHLVLPSGFAPRAAIAYTFLPPLLLLAKLGIIPDIIPDIEEACSILDELFIEWSPELPTENNLPKKVAGEIWGKIPLIYGSGPWASVAYRWKCQINENAKLHAFSHSLPEMNHNEIMGWAQPAIDYEKFAPVLLRGTENPRNALRAELLKNYLPQKVKLLEFKGKGKSILAQVFSLVYLGDLVSVLAIKGKVDPLPVLLIENLKKELAHETITEER